MIAAALPRGALMAVAVWSTTVIAAEFERDIAAFCKLEHVPDEWRSS
jgi:hypothetical protein